MDSSEWNDRYRVGRVWSGQPNAALVHHLAPVVGTGGAPEPARSRAATDAASDWQPRPSALDLGCGEGADALWLASQGWHVIGADWAGVALARARAAAQESGSEVRFVECDITDASALGALSPTGTFDLVTVGFLHPEPSDRTRFYAHLPALVAPGGHLFVLAHDPSHAARGFSGPPPHRMLTPEEILDALALPAGFETLVCTVWPHESHGVLEALDSVVLVRRAAD